MALSVFVEWKMFVTCHIKLILILIHGFLQFVVLHSTLLERGFYITQSWNCDSPPITRYSQNAVFLTYIIGYYNPSIRIIDLVSSYVVWVNFLYISGGTYSFKSTPNDRFFEKLSMVILFHSQSFWKKSAEMKSPKKYFSYFVLMAGLGLELWLFV